MDKVGLCSEDLKNKMQLTIVTVEGNISLALTLGLGMRCIMNSSGGGEEGWP